MNLPLFLHSAPGRFSQHLKRNDDDMPLKERFAVSTPTRKRSVVRAFNGETALQALRQAGFGPGREAFGFNKGQFSVIDLIEAALTFTGPADATIATWTAADADLRRVAESLRAGNLASARWLVDYSFETRQPRFCQTLRDLFGDDAIRTTASHAKFIMLRAPGWNVIIQTSMNLNQNKRLENFWISDCAELYEAFSDLVEEVFFSQAPGAGFGRKPAVRRSEMARLGSQPAPDPFDGIGSVANLASGLADDPLEG